MEICLSLVNKLQVWWFHMSNKYWPLTTNPGNKHIWTYIRTNSIPYRAFDANILLKRGPGPTTFKGHGTPQNPGIHRRESLTQHIWKQHKNMKISSGDIPNRNRRRAVGDKLHWVLIYANLSRIFPQFDLKTSSPKNSPWNLSLKLRGKPPKPFVGFFLGHVPEPNAEPSPQQAWSMAKTYHNTLLQKNKGKRIMHKYHKLHHRKLTWIPKIAIFELRYILNTIIWVSMLDFWGGQPLCNEKRPQAAFISPCQTQLFPAWR